MKSQFTIRAFLVGMAILCGYLALASRYGFGRAIICAITIVQGLTSIVFFFAAYHSYKGEHPRNALAAVILGTLILLGSLLLATIVFQPIQPPPASHFDLE